MRNNSKLNKIFIGILVLTLLVLLSLRYVFFKDSQFDFLPLLGFLLVFFSFIFSYLNVDTTRKHEFFIKRTLGLGITINPRNLFGAIIYIILMVVILLPYFIK